MMQRESIHTQDDVYHLKNDQIYPNIISNKRKQDKIDPLDRPLRIHPLV